MGRKLTLLDAMVLIAATAVAIVWTRATVADILQRSSAGVPPGIRMPWLSYLLWWSPSVVPALMASTIADFLLRLRRPRPEWPQLARQPGAVACGTATVVLILQWIVILASLGIAQIPGMTFPRRAGWLPTPWALALALENVGLAVIGAWLTLASDRCWAAEPSWIDRAGRFLGAGWIGLFLIHWLVVSTMRA